MNELIKVDYTTDRPTVSARDLHEFPEVSTEYRHWFPRMCEYGFAEGRDFNPFKNDRVQGEGGRLVTRTVDDAQISHADGHVSISKTPKITGKGQQYFIGKFLKQ